ncbi:HNH endonuclease [Gordonia alkaliphila]|uniref:HNH endonuclease signature motif containing protein n=1 Tax=Gordonia alkaliphila TaxID=1053547 RepID=UPI001FF57ADE|nr:HNH endonuclease signature motif containing protein [Gordonia alkaliphila]MCK0440515.1 HNH endonuclease [Gordonia alkaliphila]
MTQVVRTYLSHSERPESGGVLPHVTLSVPAAVIVNGQPIDSAAGVGPCRVVRIPFSDVEAQVPWLGFAGPISARTAELIMCVAHHAEHWKHGGQACLDNGVLLCRRHHMLIHQSGWEVFIGHDRHPWFVPPADLEHPKRRREAIPSNARRTLTLLPGAA